MRKKSAKNRIKNCRGHNLVQRAKAMKPELNDESTTKNLKLKIALKISKI